MLSLGAISNILITNNDDVCSLPGKEARNEWLIVASGKTALSFQHHIS